MNRELLEKKFPADLIKQRDGNFNQKLDYLEGHVIIQRLSEAFDGNWSFEIISHQIKDEEVLVLASITADGIIKTQFGSSRITRNKETREAISLGDDLKAASTDALKKCGTLFGIGLYLYDKEGRGSNPAQPTSQNHNNTAPKPNNITGARLSTKQHAFLLKLAREQSATKRELNAFTKKTYGVVSDHLGRDQASQLIDDFILGKVDLLDKTSEEAA